MFVVGSTGQAKSEQAAAARGASAASARARSSGRCCVDGKLEDREVEIEVAPQSFPMMEMIQPPQGMEGIDINFTEMLQDMLPKRKKRRTVKVPEARRILVDEELKKLVDMDDVVNEALDRVENHGIIFLDEIDKIAGERGQTGGPDVSREGVQRDLLPIVEGSTVQTRYGYVRTDHILFIAAGAFHVSKPSRPDPGAAGALPDPRGAQAAHRAGLRPDHDRAGERAHQAVPGAGRGGGRRRWSSRPRAIAEMARVAFVANERMENIGARRLHTVMATLMEDVLFELPELPEKQIVFDAAGVRERLARIVNDDDLRRYIL